MSAVLCEPSVAKSPERERIDMRIEPTTRRRAEVQAERFGVSLSAYIRRALIRQIEEDEATEPDTPRKGKR